MTFCRSVLTQAKCDEAQARYSERSIYGRNVSGHCKITSLDVILKKGILNWVCKTNKII